MTESRAKGEATRKSNAERRAQWRAETEAQEREDRALVGRAMRQVLNSPEATTREKVFATLTLDNVILGVGLVPARAAALYDRDVDLTAFKAAVAGIVEAENKGNT